MSAPYLLRLESAGIYRVVISPTPIPPAREDVRLAAPPTLATESAHAWGFSSLEEYLAELDSKS